MTRLDGLAYLDGEDDENTIALRDRHIVKRLWHGVPAPFLDPKIEAWLQENGIAYRLGTVFDPEGWDPVKLVGDFQRPGIAFDAGADAAWFRMRW